VNFVGQGFRKYLIRACECMHLIMRGHFWSHDKDEPGVNSRNDYVMMTAP